MSPFAQRSRPIDATGLFWGFLSVLAGLFYGRIYSSIWCDLSGIAVAAGCIFWQFQKWSFDSEVSTNAVEWCQKNYPLLGQTPIVDFVVAYCQITLCDVNQLTPESRFLHSDWAIEANSLMKIVLREARIPRGNVEDFSGATLEEAIKHSIAISG